MASTPTPPDALPRMVSPSVSIVICNYNYAHFIGEAVASALAQGPDCEVIVVDDGSTDGSRRWLQQVDRRVQVLLQPNGGQLAAYNAGFERSTGDVVMFLDADDALEPDAASTIARMFDEGIAKVHFRMRLVDESGHASGGEVPSSLGRGDVLPPLVRHGLLYASAPGSGNAYRRTVLQRLMPLPVDPADKVGADFFTIYGVVAFGRVAACDRALARYRLHNKVGAAAEEMVFGNAALGNQEALKVQSRYARLRELMALRTSGAVTYPPRFLDFSVQKSSFATDVLARPYLSAVFGGARLLTPLLKSIWLRPEYGVKRKLGLSAWALLVLLAPRRIGQPLARYVCNPASRAVA